MCIRDRTSVVQKVMSAKLLDDNKVKAKMNVNIFFIFPPINYLNNVLSLTIWTKKSLMI